jgi:hypothetical protein
MSDITITQEKDNASGLDWERYDGFGRLAIIITVPGQRYTYILITIASGQVITGLSYAEASLAARRYVRTASTQQAFDEPKRSAQP